MNESSQNGEILPQEEAVAPLDCPECGGEGEHIESRGYRQYGMGYGDCEELWETVDCDTCDASGVIDHDHPHYELINQHADIKENSSCE